MKKLLLILTALVFAVAAAGCGGGSKPASGGSNAKTVLKVGATPVPHAEILEIVKPMLAKQDIELKIIEFSDYVQPNMALNDKELDANFFQHEPYLLNFCAEHKLQLKNAGGVHVEPMGIYSKKVKKLEELKSGAQIAIPNDPTNGGRSLQDIVSNPKNLVFKEVEAAQVPRTLDDVDAAVINTNFAMQASLTPTKDAMFMEDKTSPYVNIVAVRNGDENRPEIKALRPHQSAGLGNRPAYPP